MLRVDKNTNWSKIALATLGIAGAIPLGIHASRAIIKRISTSALNRIIKDEYYENIWGLITGIQNKSPLTIVESNLRAERAEPVNRPFSTYKKFTHFDGLMFNCAQLHTLPTPDSIKPSLKTTIGKGTQKPFIIEMPVMIGGMAYGLALSKKAKIALAMASAKAGIATNTGQGPYLHEERKEAKYLIIQYNRGMWKKNINVLKQADMVEIQLGQGARGGVGQLFPSRQLGHEIKYELGLAIKEDAVISSRLDNMEKGSDLKEIVDKIRAITPGIPIGVKMAASKYMEKDMDIAIKAGINVITISGAQGGSTHSSPILQDGFGLPTLYALSRAVKHLKQLEKKEEIDLIIAGGIYTPEHVLKAIAMGADAVYMGTVLLYALSHIQGLKALPFEPPSQLLWHKGALKEMFNIERGANYLANYFKSTALEIEEGIRALGKKSITEVNQEDLMALDELTAKITGIEPAYIN